MRVVPDLSVPPTILVVEGQPMLDLDLIEVLQQNGYLTLKAKLTTEALELLKSWQISLVIVDTSVNDRMDGATLSRHVSESWPDIPIIACADLQRENDPVDAGPRLLNRSYDTLTLLKTVDSFCPMRAAHALN